MNAQLLIDELVRDEGLRLKPYTDSKGILTIGVGRNLRDVGITKDEAFRMLHNDLERTIADLDQHLPWWTQLDEVRQRVLVNMAFNMGIAPSAQKGKRGLADFEHMLARLKEGDFEGAATEMICSAWHGQVGDRAVRLERMMRTGVT